MSVIVLLPWTSNTKKKIWHLRLYGFDASRTARSYSYRNRSRDRQTRRANALDLWDAAGEPVFVARSASAREGDGYILSVVYRAATNTSELLILNAQDIAGEPAAVLKVPR